MTNLTDEGLKAKSKELLNQIDATERLGPAEYIYMDRIITLTLQQVRDAAKKEEREACARKADWFADNGPVGLCEAHVYNIATAIRQMDGGK